MLRPVYPRRVKQVGAERLADTVSPDIEHRVVFRSGTPSLKRRAALERTDVHHPGDPDVTAWISLANDLPNALAQQDDPARLGSANTCGVCAGSAGAGLA